MAKTLTERTDKDLKQELKDKRENLRAFRFGVSGSKAKNPYEGRILRKEIARIMTELFSRDKKTT
ncbi:MAG: 50S ribosomal protein L29 [Patescibacteria group bacterium]